MAILDKNQKKELEKVCVGFSIRKLSVFGSAARDDFGPDSDIDVLVEFHPDRVPSLGRFVDLQDALTDLFRRKVEVSTVAILNNPYRRREIENDLQELYAA
ncbi:MAG: nucleotidyltransferase family protein [Thermoleophilia bacterium]